VLSVDVGEARQPFAFEHSRRFKKFLTLCGEGYNTTYVVRMRCKSWPHHHREDGRRTVDRFSRTRHTTDAGVSVEVVTLLSHIILMRGV